MFFGLCIFGPPVNCCYSAGTGPVPQSDPSLSQYFVLNESASHFVSANLKYCFWSAGTTQLHKISFSDFSIAQLAPPLGHQNITYTPSISNKVKRKVAYTFPIIRANYGKGCDVSKPWRPAWHSQMIALQPIYLLQNMKLRSKGSH